MIYGIFWRRATKEAAIVSSIAGTIFILLTYFVMDIGNIYYVTFGLLASTILDDADEMLESYRENYVDLFGKEPKKM